ncbi:hypothetical protein Tco_0613981 [Tanacetum coccineum]
MQVSVMVEIRGLLPLVVRIMLNQSCLSRIMLELKHPGPMYREKGATADSLEHGVPALPTLPFITLSVTASPLEEGGDHTDSVTGPSLRSVAASARYVCSGETEATTVIPLLLSCYLLMLATLSSEVSMRAEYNILEERKWRSLAEEKDTQLGLLVSSLEAIEGSLRGEVASVKGYNDLLEQERNVLRLQVASLESTVAEKDRELSDLEISSSSLRSQNQGLVSQVHELETSSARLREQLDLYEGNMKRLEEFQDNLMRPLETRLAEIDADFTRCCMRFQESFHPHLLNVVAGRRWLLTHGMKLLMAKCLNSTKYMKTLGNAFGRAIEKGMQEGLEARIEHGQAGRCLTDLEAYILSAEVDFNSVVRDLYGLNFPLLQELSNKKDASTWDVMDLLRLDDAVAEALGMTDLQPDVNQLMVPVHHKQDRVVIGSQALSVALDICRGRVVKMERNLVERLPFLKGVFVSLDYLLSAEALIKPPVVVPATNALSTVVIVPHFSPYVSVEDYENPDLVDMVSENVTLGPEGEENIDASTGGDLAFSKLDDEARDVVL